MATDNAITLTAGQQAAFDKFKLFSTSVRDKVFILTGYAGTGKTTLMKHFIDYMERNNIMFCLLASTGRAAKILRDATQRQAKTIHSYLYTFNGLNQDLDEHFSQAKQLSDIVDKTGQLCLEFDLEPLPADQQTQCVYIVDESSMISDTAPHDITQARFGSGRLLSDLLAFNPKGKFVFVGDDAQLPPINGSGMPALEAEYFKANFNITPVTANLTQIMRQKGTNDIIVAADKIRKMRFTTTYSKWGKLPLLGYQNIVLHGSETDMRNAYMRLIEQRGYNAATYICYSNKTCKDYAGILRAKMQFARSGNMLCVGDLLLVTQNNIITGLQNGDLVEVVQIGEMTPRANLCFRKVEVKEIASGDVYSQYLIEDIISAGNTNLAERQQRSLYIDYYLRMKEKGIKQKTEEFKEGMRKDEFLNALRCTYGYALTCHKAQGGEWDDVFVEIPNHISLSLGNTPGLCTRQQALQWVYTAVTRASKTLHLLNSWIFE